MLIFATRRALWQPTGLLFDPHAALGSHFGTQRAPGWSKTSLGLQKTVRFGAVLVSFWAYFRWLCDEEHYRRHFRVADNYSILEY